MESIFILTIPLYILYIMGLMLFMFSKRTHALRKGDLRLSYFRSYQGETPQHLQVIKNHFDNQFQVPLLYMVTCLAAVHMQVVSGITVALGYYFIFSRVVHSLIHLGSNDVKKRAVVYFSGIIAVILIWFEIIFTRLI